MIQRVRNFMDGADTVRALLQTTAFAVLGEKASVSPIDRNDVQVSDHDGRTMMFAPGFGYDLSMWRLGRHCV